MNAHSQNSQLCLSVFRFIRSRDLGGLLESIRLAAKGERSPDPGTKRVRYSFAVELSAVSFVSVERYLLAEKAPVKSRLIEATPA